MRFAAPVRRQLPFRTLFNLVGPLANPARPEYQLVGVAGERQADLIADALARLGTARAAVVTGSDGLDEVTLAGPTRVLWVESGRIAPEVWHPDDFGLPRVTAADLRVSGPAESAALIRAMLAGEPGPVRDDRPGQRRRGVAGGRSGRDLEGWCGPGRRGDRLGRGE